jgi:hypothetical protein
MVSRIANGSQVGTNQVGIACNGQSRIVESVGNGLEVKDEAIRAVIHGELKAVGFRFPDDDGSLFPGAKSQPGQPGQPELLLAGAMTSLAINRCFPRIGLGDRSHSSAETSVEIEWQILDVARREVVLKIVTGGTARSLAVDRGAANAYYGGITNALRNLMATPDFMAVTRQPQRP